MRLLLIPDDSGQTEDLLGNGPNMVVRVTVRGPPVLGQAAASRVVDNLHGPAELQKELFVRETGLSFHLAKARRHGPWASTLILAQNWFRREREYSETGDERIARLNR